MITIYRYSFIFLMKTLYFFFPFPFWALGGYFFLLLYSSFFFPSFYGIWFFFSDSLFGWHFIFVFLSTSVSLIFAVELFLPSQPKFLFFCGQHSFSIQLVEAAPVLRGEGKCSFYLCFPMSGSNTTVNIEMKTQTNCTVVYMKVLWASALLLIVLK